VGVSVVEDAHWLLGDRIDVVGMTSWWRTIGRPVRPILFTTKNFRFLLCYNLLAGSNVFLLGLPDVGEKVLLLLDLGHLVLIDQLGLIYYRCSIGRSHQAQVRFRL
jgi:hypothetical protein